MRFERLTLRTTDPDAARAFYEPLLEHGCPDVTTLPAQAVARGARPHWLGWLGVDDVEATTAALLARGGQQLSPGILRDPGGAVLGLTARTSTPLRPDVIWHQLMAPDVDAAAALYAPLFAVDDPPVAAVTSLTGHPEIHPQWLHHFRTRDLERTRAAVLAAGGLALPVFTLPSGVRIAACDDPQGGAFGLMQPA